MKLTHTLCAALLLGAVSSPAFAQNKSSGKHIPKVTFECAAENTDNAKDSANAKACESTTKFTGARHWNLEKNMQAIAAPTGGRTAGRAEFQDLAIAKRNPKEMAYATSDIGTKKEWIEILNISTGIKKRMPKEEAYVFLKNDGKKEWLEIENFSKKTDGSTPDLHLHCANGKAVKGKGGNCDAAIKIEGIDGESTD